MYLCLQASLLHNSMERETQKRQGDNWAVSQTLEAVLMQFLAHWHHGWELGGEKQTKIHAKISTKTSGIIVIMDEGNSFMPEIYTKTCTHLECHTELSPHCLQSHHLLSVTIWIQLTTNVRTHGGHWIWVWAQIQPPGINGDCSVDFLPHLRVVDKSTFADVFHKSTFADWEVAAEMSRESNAACIFSSKQFLAISSNLQ